MKKWGLLVIRNIGLCLSSFVSSVTLKRRILIIFLLSSILPMLCVVFVSYGAISSILTNKIQMGIEGNLSQVLLSLENSIRSLNYVSQQLTFEGSVGRNFDQYLIENDP